MKEFSARATHFHLLKFFHFGPLRHLPSGHREIRWRTATLEEADSVLIAYHAQRNLAMAPNYIVTSSNMKRRDSDLRIEQHQELDEKDEASDAQPEELVARIVEAYDRAAASKRERAYAKPDTGQNMSSHHDGCPDTRTGHAGTTVPSLKFTGRPARSDVAPVISARADTLDSAAWSR